jgi:hypothetical protein
MNKRAIIDHLAEGTIRAFAATRPPTLAFRWFRMFARS